MRHSLPKQSSDEDDFKSRGPSDADISRKISAPLILMTEGGCRETENRGREEEGKFEPSGGPPEQILEGGQKESRPQYSSKLTADIPAFDEVMF